MEAQRRACACKLGKVLSIHGIIRGIVIANLFQPQINRGRCDCIGNSDRGGNNGSDSPENMPSDPSAADPENGQSADNTENSGADNLGVSDITEPDNSVKAVKTPNTGIRIAVPVMLLGAAAIVVTVRKKRS